MNNNIVHFIDTTYSTNISHISDEFGNVKELTNSKYEHVTHNKSF